MQSEKGQSMVMLSILTVLVFLPLLAIAMNIPKAIYVRVQLQAAADAACEAAAQAVDLKQFNDTGQAKIDLGQGSAWAYREFGKTVINAGIVGYSPSLNSIFLISPLVVECNATANVETFFNRLINVRFKVSATSVSETKVGRK